MSRKLSWLLRHGAHEVGLSMDAAGWATVDDVLRHVRATRRALETVVRTNDKGRYQLVGARIRACQGHSTSGTPVTADALEASWERVSRDRLLYHGTSPDSVAVIAQSGALRPMARTHVHLADTPDAKVGKRANVGVLLVVAPQRLEAAGHRVFRSPNGVLLVREVPWDCVVDLVAVSRRARAAHEALRRQLIHDASPLPPR
ncbi:MAG: tRNA 2'-phosphotransferase [Myxococcota bacterium]